MTEGLYIAGTGSFAAELADWAAASGQRPLGLIELRDPTRVGMLMHGFEVCPLAQVPSGARAVLGVGGDRRETWAALEQAGWAGGGLVHRRAELAGSAEVSDTSTIGPLAVIGAASTVAEHVIVSRGALIGHHVHVGDFAMLNPGVNVGGNACVGADAFLGMGCVVANGVSIGRGAVIAAGAVVIRDVEPGVRVQGVPARLYR